VVYKLAPDCASPPTELRTAEPPLGCAYWRQLRTVANTEMPTYIARLAHAHSSGVTVLGRSSVGVLYIDVSAAPRPEFDYAPDPSRTSFSECT
jgi:hypothetical protein